MTNEQKYLDLIPILNSNHFYPAKQIEVGKKGEKLVGLEIACPPILKTSRLEKVREAIGEGFRADFLGNGRDVIEIRAVGQKSAG